MGIREAPQWYAEWRATLGIDTVEYGVGASGSFGPMNWHKAKLVSPSQAMASRWLALAPAIGGRNGW